MNAAESFRESIDAWVFVSILADNGIKPSNAIALTVNSYPALFGGLKPLRKALGF
jgi:hypothetical protein